MATLSEPGWLTDQWIGQFCTTGSGQHAVVVYGPRQFTNREELMDRGGFAAVVNLSTGSVTKLGAGASLAYYNPGCGADEIATISRLEVGTDRTETWIGAVDATTGKITRQIRAEGQLTGVIPVRGEVVAVRGKSLVAFDRGGTERVLATTASAPFRVYPDGKAGIAFQTTDQKTVRFHRLVGGRVTEIGNAPVGTVKLRPGHGGSVFLAGFEATKRLRDLPISWRAMDTAPDSDISSNGRLAVSYVASRSRREKRDDVAPSNDDLPDEVEIVARAASGSSVTFNMRPQPKANQRSAPLPSPGARSMSSNDYSNIPYEPDRACGISRNDPAIQVYQPNFTQVEWAANLAVKNKLTFQRPANWANNGLPAYSPQGLFPQIPLVGGGTVPAQVLLGILAQESNLWQASWHSVDGSAGNPLTSLGYYGLDLEHPDFHAINWNKVDCGYGVAQVTTGMRLDDRGKSIDGVTITELHQKAVALDYATNVAAGLRILQSKWNQTRSAGIVANDGDPKYIENWWFAIWAYNTGFYPDKGDGSPWGVGWANNPANPRYPADRKMFLTAPLDVPTANPPIDDEIGYDNAKHPNHWSYPERVMGWAYKSLIKYDFKNKDYAPTYRTATPGADKFAAQPDRFAFCSSFTNGGNECAVGTENPNDLGDPAGPCTRPDLKCWWHTPTTWTDCAAYCGQESLTYVNVDPRPFYDPIYPSQCSVVGLPAGVKIIDDINVTQKTGPQGCSPNWSKGGTFSLKFGEFVRDGQTYYPSKVDFHQIGAGFGGHFWFTHTRYNTPGNNDIKVTGRWNIDPTNAWTRVFVHMPDHGAHTQQAHYQINLPNGQTRKRVIPTRYEKNTWVDIGVFDFTGAGQPSVELSNFTATDGERNLDVAWDAIAVQALPAKPRHIVVALGDSYSSGEGTSDYDHVSNQYGNDEVLKNACRRSPWAWSRQVTLQGAPAKIGSLEASKDPNLDYHMVACSGARTHNLIHAGTKNAFGKLGHGQYWEVPQLDSGFVDPDTTLVMLTIGGNDARFAAVLQGCMLNNPTGDGCADEDFYLQGKDEDENEFRDPEPLYIYEPKIIREFVAPSIKLVIDQIKVAAPNAKILLLGYPRIFDGYDPVKLPVCVDGLSYKEADFLNAMGDIMLTDATAPNSGGQVMGADPRATFRNHGVCTDDPYINGLDLTPSGGGDTERPGMDSFHPNNAGYAAEGIVVSDRLSAGGVVW